MDEMCLLAAEQVWSESLNTISIPCVLVHLIYLQLQRSSVSSLSIHWLALSANHVLVVFCIVWVRILKGLSNLYPHLWNPVAAWDLNLVLYPFMKSPFEPFVECSLTYLSVKTAFIIAIMSGWRVSKLHALMAGLPFTIFHKDYVVLWPDPRFFPKIMSEFHINQPIHLLVFFSRAHVNKRKCTSHNFRC